MSNLNHLKTLLTLKLTIMLELTQEVIMKISEFSKTTGLSTQTVRYYESIGLLIPERLDNKYRIYSDQDVSDSIIISALKTSGMSLEDITIVMNLKRKEISSFCKAETVDFIKKYQSSIDSKILLLNKVKSIFTIILQSIQDTTDYDEDSLIKLIESLSSQEGL